MFKGFRSRLCDGHGLTDFLTFINNDNFTGDLKHLLLYIMSYIDSNWKVHAIGNMKSTL